LRKREKLKKLLKELAKAAGFPLDQLEQMISFTAASLGVPNVKVNVEQLLDSMVKDPDRLELILMNIYTTLKRYFEQELKPKQEAKDIIKQFVEG